MVDLAVVRQGGMVIYRDGREVARIEREVFIPLMQDMLAEIRFPTDQNAIPPDRAGSRRPSR